MVFQPDCSKDVFLQSFGLDDLIATCFGGRNVRAAEVFARDKKTLEEIERDLLNGQKLQGPGTIMTVHSILKSKNIISNFPFMEYIFKVLNENEPAESVIHVFNS
ncbi:Glycerol-3-phosphate dehydrogenase [NAD(+)], cytoplasmic [Thelohanellus kitauei]|uniref:glycerol-3-phosphate dehydrogenase (NAD(+)) n=1 Tax=Thelohanellus kitauei TaxID=669202 RepID=A0A0C2N2Y5_THEKT|nr:Glycerol-3-phosphate dehydrogenase [NAD(+)], cytoplasmic [Thelohanellus kitauei]